MTTQKTIPGRCFPFIRMILGLSPGEPRSEVLWLIWPIYYGARAECWIIYLYKSNGSGRSGIFGSSFCEARIAARWSKRFIMTSAFVNSIILTSNAKLLKIIIQSSDNSFSKSFRHELSHDNIDEHSKSV